MTYRINEFNQPVGEACPDWQPRPLPERKTLTGVYCRLEPLSRQAHAASLYDAWQQAPDQSGWTYLFAGPFDSQAAFDAWLGMAEQSLDPLHYAVVDTASGQALGSLSLMRQDPKNGVIEVGSVTFSPRLRRTTLATEAHFLLMRYVFDTLGYRRYEWKCDSLNAPSRKAAERFGFQFEGIFRQAIIYKGRTRDTAWYSLLDKEWPTVKHAFVTWLSPDNFDAQGKQRRPLAARPSAQEENER